MREYQKRDRNDDYEVYVPREQREYAPREPRDRHDGAIARVRVELKKKYNDSDRNFKEMMQAFRREVSKAGIMHELKEREYYVSEGERRRKAKRESHKNILMEDLTKKIVAGERIEGHGGMVKKIMSNIKKEKEKELKKQERNKNFKNFD